MENVSKFLLANTENKHVNRLSVASSYLIGCAAAVYLLSKTRYFTAATFSLGIGAPFLQLGLYFSAATAKFAPTQPKQIKKIKAFVMSSPLLLGIATIGMLASLKSTYDSFRNFSNYAQQFYANSLPQLSESIKTFSFRQYVRASKDIFSTHMQLLRADRRYLSLVGSTSWKQAVNLVSSGALMLGSYAHIRSAAEFKAIINRNPEVQ